MRAQHMYRIVTFTIDTSKEAKSPLFSMNKHVQFSTKKISGNDHC